MLRINRIDGVCIDCFNGSYGLQKFVDSERNATSWWTSWQRLQHGTLERSTTPLHVDSTVFLAELQPSCRRPRVRFWSLPDETVPLVNHELPQPPPCLGRRSQSPTPSSVPPLSLSHTLPPSSAVRHCPRERTQRLPIIDTSPSTSLSSS